LIEKGRFMDQDAPQAAVERLPVAVIGAGSIGVSFALLFAVAGRQVRIQDPSAEALAAVPGTVAATLAALREHGLVACATDEVCARLTLCTEVAEAVHGVDHVQECAPERLELKQALFAELDALAPPEAVLASSSSAMPASSFAAGLPGAARCLVLHPGNPPFLLRVIELVPAPFTSPETVARTRRFVAEVGLRAVLVQRELEGFVFNRLQGALLREAWCLVRDGVATVEDIDTVVREGLGLRWAVIGPFETADLNTRGGVASHAVKLGPAYERMGAERGQHDPWTPALVAEVVAQRRALLPLEEWDARVAWRDRMLMAVIAAKQRPVI
jgi:L-gulonate 3-dehydrogenase